MSIIAGSVDFSSNPDAQANIFSDCFAKFKHAYHKRWQDKSVSLRYWHQSISPSSEGEVQPLLDDELVLVGDLRLDNRTELIKKLGGLSSSSTDSEMVLAAYRKWQGQCVNHLVGGFAFAIWDRRLKSLFCARDQMGQKPLFYCEANDGYDHCFMFCTSPAGILNHSRSSSDIDPQGVFNILMGRTCNEETSTLFSGIKRLAAGFCLRVNHTGIELKRYWEPEPVRSIRFADDREYVEGFNEKLEQAVESCINTDFPVSSFLSGGLDSSTVACMAHKKLQQNSRRLISTTFVLPDNEDGVDEKTYVDSILAENDFDHFYVTRENVGFRECLHNSQELYGGYPHTSHAYFNNLLPALVERNVGVHLCGYGGDQVASYHGMWVFEQLLLEGRWIAMLNLLKSTSNGRLRSGAKTIFRTLVNIMQATVPDSRNRDWYDRKIARRMILPDLANRPGYRENVLRRASFDVYPFPWKITDVMKRFIQYDRTSVTLETLSNTFLPYGIEYRTPLTDIRLIDYCMSLPPEQFYLGGKRGLMRRSIQGLVPEHIRLAHNKQQGSTPNLFLGLWQEKDQLVEDLNNCAHINDISKLLDIPRIKRQLEKNSVNERDRPKLYRNLELALYISWFKNHF